MGYIVDEKFEKIIFSEKPLKPGEYEECTFDRCDFSNARLAEFRFIDCEFRDCNLSLVVLNNTTFRDVKFVGCKMLGLHFEDCDLLGFTVSFENCKLQNSTFFKVKMKKTVLKNCDLKETDFSEAEMSESIFDNCDLHRAVFDHTNLEKVDFRTAYNYTINPSQNRIKKARFSLPGLPGLLAEYGIDVSD
ncbi:MAG TPA: pentapeptide repeat-containing protein [Bacteroidales bacterium]|nr:pentapeptide repeat-containing protein [Bacteroidales bacterium]